MHHFRLLVLLTGLLISAGCTVHSHQGCNGHAHSHKSPRQTPTPSVVLPIKDLSTNEIADEDIVPETGTLTVALPNTSAAQTSRMEVPEHTQKLVSYLKQDKGMAKWVAADSSAISMSSVQPDPTHSQANTLGKISFWSGIAILPALINISSLGWLIAFLGPVAIGLGMVSLIFYKKTTNKKGKIFPVIGIALGSLFFLLLMVLFVDALKTLSEW